MYRSPMLSLGKSGAGRTTGYIVLVIVLCALAFATARWVQEDRRVPPPPVAEPAPVAGERVVYPVTQEPTLTLPNGETRAVHSVLNITRKLSFGDYLWNDTNIKAGPVWVRVDLARQMLSVFRGGHEIGSAVILFGTDGKPTPSGVFPILQKAKEHRSSLYDAEMPYMLRLTGDGVAVHASAVRRGSATHGCIGVPIAFARLLFDQVRRGDVVAIMPAA